jgi:hypothetical protein
MANTEKCCSTANDVVASTLGKVGINRSLLVTLALLPFAWDGVNWVAGACRELWNLIASV